MENIISPPRSTPIVNRLFFYSKNRVWSIANKNHTTSWLMLIPVGEFCFNSPVFIIQERSFIFSGWFYLILLGIFIISVIVGYFVNLQRLRKQNEELKKIIDKRTRDIQKQNRQLREQSQKLESYFRSTSESIRYASKIQNALLPHPGLLQECFEDSFIYLNPKEDIRGDFYWHFFRLLTG